MKPMSEVDMSFFLGASGVDPSQAAAAGFPVSTNSTELPDAKKVPSGPAPKPAPPKTVPSGPAAAKGTSIRGRAAAAAGTSTTSRGGRAVSPTLPPNVPSGPKNPGKRYNDRDMGAGGADLLDYGATSGGGGDDYADGWDTKERSPERSHRRGATASRSRREGTQDQHDSASANGRDDDGYTLRRGATSSRSKRTDDWDEETASQSSAGGRRRRTGGSHRESHRERESSSSHRDRSERAREREKEREREARSQARSERRAGRDLDDPAIPTGPSAGSGRASRKRSAPEDRDAEDEGKSSSSRKSGSRKKR